MGDTNIEYVHKWWKPVKSIGALDECTKIYTAPCSREVCMMIMKSGYLSSKGFIQSILQLFPFMLNL